MMIHHLVSDEDEVVESPVSGFEWPDKKHKPHKPEAKEPEPKPSTRRKRKVSPSPSPARAPKRRNSRKQRVLSSLSSSEDPLGTDSSSSDHDQGDDDASEDDESEEEELAEDSADSEELDELASPKPAAKKLKRKNAAAAVPLVLGGTEGTGQVAVPGSVATELQPHQVEGVQFMWRSLFQESPTAPLKDGKLLSGCVLAHCMGLGKTLQVIALLAAVMANERVGVSHVLVLVPVNVLINWQKEVTKWLGPEPGFAVFSLADAGAANAKRAALLQEWQDCGGICLVGYDQFRNLVTGARIKNAKHKKVFETVLLEAAQLVVCDEGHILRNGNAKLTQSVHRISAKRRMLLTGTPLQNNLLEYFTMVDFVRPSVLGTSRQFQQKFVRPILEGQCTDSTAEQVQQMKERVHVLHGMLEDCVDRKDYRILAKLLPTKYEYVISIRLTALQADLYRTYLEKQQAGATTSNAKLFGAYHELCKVWTHPSMLEGIQALERDSKAYDSIDDFVVESSDEEWAADTKGHKKTVERSNKQSDRGVPAEGADAERANWWGNKLDAVGLHSDLESVSGKLVFLLELLDQVSKTGDKMLLFSQSLEVLELIEQVLNSDTGGKGKASRWQLGKDYFRCVAAAGCVGESAPAGWMELLARRCDKGGLIGSTTNTTKEPDCS